MPTLIDKYKQPHLTFLVMAFTALDRGLKAEDIMIYESTVYLGITEEVRILELERNLGVILDNAFFDGYGTKRIDSSIKSSV